METYIKPLNCATPVLTRKIQTSAWTKQWTRWRTFQGFIWLAVPCLRGEMEGNMAAGIHLHDGSNEKLENTFNGGLLCFDGWRKRLQEVKILERKLSNSVMRYFQFVLMKWMGFKTDLITLPIYCHSHSERKKCSMNCTCTCIPLFFIFCLIIVLFFILLHFYLI